MVPEDSIEVYESASEHDDSLDQQYEPDSIPESEEDEVRPPSRSSVVGKRVVPSLSLPNEATTNARDNWAPKSQPRNFRPQQLYPQGQSSKSQQDMGAQELSSKFQQEMEAPRMYTGKRLEKTRGALEDVSAATSNQFLNHVDARKFRREDYKILRNDSAIRRQAGRKPHSVQVTRAGIIVGGCLGKDKYLDDLKVLALRMLDLSVLKVKDQTSLELVRMNLDDMYEYMDHQLNDYWFREIVGKVLRRCRSDLHREWLAGGRQRNARVPANVQPAQWFSLIDYWSSPAFVKKSEQMKLSRAAVKVVNLTGRAGYAGQVANMKRKRGKTPPLCDIQLELQTRKDKQLKKIGCVASNPSSFLQDGETSQPSFVPSENMSTPTTKVEKSATDCYPSKKPSNIHTGVTAEMVDYTLSEKVAAMHSEQAKLTTGFEAIQEEQKDMKDTLNQLGAKMDIFISMLSALKPVDPVDKSPVQNVDTIIETRPLEKVTSIPEQYTSVPEQRITGSEHSTASLEKGSKGKVSEVSAQVRVSTFSEENSDNKFSVEGDLKVKFEANSTHSSKKKTYSRKIRHFAIGDEVELRQIGNGRVIGGTGIVQGLGGSKFHGKEVLFGTAIVELKKVYHPNLPLYVTNANDDPPQVVLGDAVGSRVIWLEKSLRRSINDQTDAYKAIQDQCQNRIERT